VKKPLEKYKDKELFRPYRPHMPDLFSKIHCPSCENEVGYNDINIDRSIAKCSHCEHVFTFEGELSPMLERNKAEIFQPEGIEILHLMSELVIDYKWRHTKSVSGGLIFFAIVWNAMLLPFILSAILSGQFLVLIFISLHLAVGLGLIGNIVSTLINRTSISVDDQQLSIEHKPLKIPFIKEYNINVDDIDQLYVKRYVSSRTNGVANYAFSVNAKVSGINGNKDVSILKGLKKENKALYIEQEIELYLGIKDRRVPGEIKQ